MRFDNFACSKIIVEHYDAEIKHLGYSEDSYVYYIPSKSIVVKCIESLEGSCETEVNKKLFNLNDQPIGLIKPLNIHTFEYISFYLTTRGFVRETTEYFLFEYDYYKYNLESFLKESLVLSETTKLDIIEQIKQGINTLHSLGYYHGDLKPKNICISDDGKIIKIIDYGLCDSVENKEAELYWKNTLYSASPLQLGRHIQAYDDYKKYFDNIKTQVKLIYNKDPIIYKNKQVFRESCITNDWFGVGLLIYYVLTNGTYFFSGLSVNENASDKVIIKQTFNNVLLFLKDPIQYCKNKNNKHSELYEPYILKDIILNSNL